MSDRETTGDGGGGRGWELELLKIAEGPIFESTYGTPAGLG